MSISIDTMVKRVIPRIEKFTFDRVWNEPYLEYRTNTRPRILNPKTLKSVNGAALEVYSPLSGVLTGEFEQIELPRSGLFYVYSIEPNQFRSLNPRTPDWVSLEEYCNLNRTEIRVYSDDGVSLWRAGIFIKQTADGEHFLMAVDAVMLNRCMDTYARINGELVSVYPADPSAIFFTKYLDSDRTKDGIKKVINDGDNKISCSQLTSADIVNNRFGLTGLESLAFYNGRILMTTGTFSSQFLRGGYIEAFTDPDIIHIGRMSKSTCPKYEINVGTESRPSMKTRVICHVPKAKNKENWLITYNTCDVYLIPNELTESKMDGGFDDKCAGVWVHMCGRADRFHQLTHNDFSVDLDLLDEVAQKNGFVTDDYKIHFVVRHHEKKQGLVRDANYCDLLYTKTHTDEDIVGLLTGSDETMPFWTAAYLEKHNFYAVAMLDRVGPTIPESEAAMASQSNAYRPTVDKFYDPSRKSYYLRDTSSEPTLTPVDEKGLLHPIDVIDYKNDPAGYIPLNVLSGDRVDPSAMENYPYRFHKVTPTDQCQYCKIYNQCERHDPGKTFTGCKCEQFAHRGLVDFIRIYGYYNFLQMICRRVTTYRALENLTLDAASDESAERWKPTTTEPTMKWHKDDLEPSMVVCDPTYTKSELVFPVRIPLALFDLEATEWHPIVYVNGEKLADDQVEVIGYKMTPTIENLEEIFWTYTPGFGEDILWKEDQKKLVVKIKGDSVKIKKDDYVAIELIPDPTVDEGSEVQLPVTMSSTTFSIEPVHDDVEHGKFAYAHLGSNLEIERNNSELVFLNGKQLVIGIDYTKFSDYEPEDFKPTIQNISYLKRDNNILEAISTTDTIIGTNKGFVLGNVIDWDGVAPFWYDNMSILTVGGKVVSNFTYEESRLILKDGAHVNGEPFMVRTSVPQMVIDMLNFTNDETGKTYAESDSDTLTSIRNYFSKRATALPYRAVIPYSHKIYSTYLETIVSKLIDPNDPFDIDLIDDVEEFRAQEVLNSEELLKIKKYDVVFDSRNGIVEDDLRFLDIYPAYHNIMSDPRTRRKLEFLLKKMSPEDLIRHREHIQ